MQSGRVQIAVVGAGFAGSILARILQSSGLDVALLERGHHPRFALGESSTPLAALCLERLARRYEQPDLGWLSTWGRWGRYLPQLRRGLKRGFTFYHHQRHRPLRASHENENRLLVAASPEDAVADCHWLREDVDDYLAQRAVAAGVLYRDRFEIESLERGGSGGWRLRGSHEGEAIELEAEIVIDGSGAGGFLGKALPIESAEESLAVDTGLVYAHLEGLAPLPRFEAGPYPDERAAIHHLLEEGWVYVLPFDHGVASVGLLLRRSVLEAHVAAGKGSPEAIWNQVIETYPTLSEQFEQARTVRPFELMPRVQRLLARAAGADWALLPHTYAFIDPMFSMGIAWSLLGVERLAEVLVAAFRSGGLDREAAASGLARYRSLLEAEVGQIASLLEGAYLAMHDFRLFTAQSFLYFATVSFEEVLQRLYPQGRSGVSPAWRGFLGATEAGQRQLFQTACEKLTHRVSPRSTATGNRAFSDWVAAQIADRNVAGLADPGRRNLYPVDLELLLDRASLLDMDRTELEPKLPLLRGIG